jgi:hypothetical protein
MDVIGLKAVLKISHEKKAPRGIVGEFKADISDGLVEWTFKDRLSTLILVSEMSLKNTPDEWVSFDIKKNVATTKYPGKTKEEIKDKLEGELKRFQK